MACDGDDVRLLLVINAIVSINLANNLCCFVAIHEWHVAIHQDQLVQVWLTLVKGRLDLLNSLLSIVGKI
jgi:hypothetical protein